MPTRLSDEDQKKADESWNKALTPINKLDHQAVLDGMIVTQAFQFGVDRLDFKSEKDVAVGTVVMEMRYDRRSPERDRFAVRVEDKSGHILRQDYFSRDEFERTEKELKSEYSTLEKAKEDGTLGDDDAKRLVLLDARFMAAMNLLPMDLLQPKPAPTTAASIKAQP